MAEEIKNNVPEEEAQVFTLTDENGVETDFELLHTMDIDGETYLALIPVGDEESGEYVILKLIEEDGEEVLETIDDDEEFEKVADLFDAELFGEIDYDAE